LIHGIYETVKKEKISMEEIKQLPVSVKNKLVSENVTQSTIHFAKRTDKLMSLLENGGMFVHKGKDFKVDSYFYRVEFQAFIVYSGWKMMRKRSLHQCGMKRRRILKILEMK
jgi:hypothetical protein